MQISNVCQNGYIKNHRNNNPEALRSAKSVQGFGAGSNPSLSSGATDGLQTPLIMIVVTRKRKRKKKGRMVCTYGFVRIELRKFFFLGFTIILLKPFAFSF